MDDISTTSILFSSGRRSPNSVCFLSLSLNHTLTFSLSNSLSLYHFLSLSQTPFLWITLSLKLPFSESLSLKLPFSESLFHILSLSLSLFLSWKSEITFLFTHHYILTASNKCPFLPNQFFNICKMSQFSKNGKGEILFWLNQTIKSKAILPHWHVISLNSTQNTPISMWPDFAKFYQFAKATDLCVVLSSCLSWMDQRVFVYAPGRR